MIKTIYKIEAMDCPTEEGLIRTKLNKMPGINSLDFNLVQRVLTVEHSIDKPETIALAIQSLGFDAIIQNSNTKNISPSPKQSFVSSWGLLVIGGLAALSSELMEITDIWIPWGPAIGAIIAIGLSGIGTYKKGWISIVNGSLNINALMSLAVTGALILGEWPEAAMVMVLFALAEKIEGFSLDKARSAIQHLLDLSPTEARVLNSDKSTTRLPASEIAPNTIVVVGPGERIPLDGYVTEGFASVDQAAITGESLPVEKEPGHSVYAGTIVLNAEILVKVSASAQNSLLARIIHMVEEAQAKRSKTQTFIDAFAKVYTPGILVLALLIGIVPPIFFAGDLASWAYRALVLLIIACPCALVISTPVTLVSALTKAARLGIIIKGGIYLEQAAKLDYLVFDKTGTLSTGKLTLMDTHQVDTQYDYKTMARSLALRSNHPVSQAVADGLLREGLLTENASKPSISALKAHAGLGLEADIDGVPCAWGNKKLMATLGISTDNLEEKLDAWEAEAKSVVIFAYAKSAVLAFSLADTLKPGTEAVLKTLHDKGLRTVLLSGDNNRTVEILAKEAGLDEAFGELLPQEKAYKIQALQNNKHLVAMVGDGINDAPALAQANIGIAMGGLGTDAAIETADLVIMDDKLEKIPLLIELSRQTRRVLVQNIVLALAIKAAFLLISILGFATMWMAVFADMGASLLVVFNGLSLMRWRPRGSARTSVLLL